MFLQYQVISPENIHTSNITCVEQMYLRILEYTYIHICNDNYMEMEHEVTYLKMKKVIWKGLERKEKGDDIV